MVGDGVTALASNRDVVSSAANSVLKISLRGWAALSINILLSFGTAETSTIVMSTRVTADPTDMIAAFRAASLLKQIRPLKRTAASTDIELSLLTADPADV